MNHATDPHVSAAVIQTHGVIAAAILGAIASIVAEARAWLNEESMR